MIHRSLFTPLAAGAVLAVALFFSPAVQAVDVTDAVAWDTLGYPDVTHLPYVRVATGRWIKFGNKTPENRFAEGFLLSEEPGAFTVFICGVSRFKDHFGGDEPYPALTTVRFVRKTDGPDYEHVTDEVLDFKTVASEALARVRSRQKSPEPFENLQGGEPPGHRARIFALARACQQKGLADTAAELMDIAANIRDWQTGKVEPAALREELQQQFGDAVLNKAEEDFPNPKISWADHLKAYEHFDTRFPANQRVGYAREAADILRKMIAEEAAHHPKPLDQMSPAEQVAENIYQLRNLGYCAWGLTGHYPLSAWTPGGKEITTPVHRLVDLGHAAVPQLIEALDDRRFTRMSEAIASTVTSPGPPPVPRIGDIAQRILEFMSGRSFYRRVTEAGKPTGPTTREQAEAWWVEVQGHGEKEALIKTVSAGGQQGRLAARQLVQKYPDAALEAIEAGMRATPEDGERGEYVQEAAKLPGDAPLAFLRAKLAPTNGLYSQIFAAQALFARGQPDAVPAMIQAWQTIQPRLPADDGDAWSEVGGIISFLTHSGDPAAIAALERESPKNPVDVRFAIVKMFMPEPMSYSANGKMVDVDLWSGPRPAPKPTLAGEHLLISALADTARRFAVNGFYKQESFTDPRICDMAALALSVSWPEKYPFHWARSAAECDAQIAKMQNRWRADHGLPPLAPPAPIVIPAAKESEVAPLLDQYASAADDAGREAITNRIAETFGLGALPAVRARLAAPQNAAAYRPLAIDLASRVREVRISPEASSSGAKTDFASLKGQSLNGARLSKLADALQATLPPEIRAVTVIVERPGNGTGFVVTLEAIPGELAGQTGWDRDMVVQGGEKNFYTKSYYAREGSTPKKVSLYSDFGGAFEKAIQSDIDAPIFTRLRLQRSKVGK